MKASVENTKKRRIVFMVNKKNRFGDELSIMGSKCQGQCGDHCACSHCKCGK